MCPVHPTGFDRNGMQRSATEGRSEPPAEQENPTVATEPVAVDTLPDGILETLLREGSRAFFRASKTRTDFQI